MRSDIAGSVQRSRTARIASKPWAKIATSISIPEVDQQDAAIALKIFYAECRQMKFGDAICKLAGFYQLIRHNPHFKAEVEAIRRIIEAEDVLNKFSAKVDKL